MCKSIIDSIFNNMAISRVGLRKRSTRVFSLVMRPDAVAGEFSNVLVRVAEVD